MAIRRRKEAFSDPIFEAEIAAIREERLSLERGRTGHGMVVNEGGEPSVASDPAFTRNNHIPHLTALPPSKLKPKEKADAQSPAG